MNGSWTQEILSTRWGQIIKQPLRAAIARTGYELVPVERDETSNTKRLISDSRVGLVIDVGANQGQYAMHMRAMGYAGRILSFEPGSAAFALLARNADKDPLWEARRLALGSHSASAELNVARNSVSSSLLSINDEHLKSSPSSATKSSELVPVRRLDDELADMDDHMWLKIDTQGYEMEILRGAEGVLQQTEVLQLELSLRLLYAGQADWMDVMNVINDNGFDLIDIIPGFRSARGELLQCDVIARRGNHLN